MPNERDRSERLHKLAASMHNPNRNEALNAFNAFLAELAKEDEAQFSVEYSLGNISSEDTEEAERELSRLRAELAEAFESTSRDETTINQLQEIIDRLHVEMAEVHQALRESQGSPLPPPPPEPLTKPNRQKAKKEIERTPPTLPPQPFDWGTGEHFTEELPQTRVVRSELFTWKSLATWAYGLALVFWLAMVCLPGLRNSHCSLFLPLLWVVAGVPGFIYFRELRESHGWTGVAVKVCLTADLLAIFTAVCVYYGWRLPILTPREEVFGFAVGFGTLWFLYSGKFFAWVLDEQKRTQFVVFPGAVVILLCVVSWVTATDSRAVKASEPLHQSIQSPHVKKPHPSPKPTPPPDNPPQILNYDFELPPRPSSPVLLETSYSPATAPPHLIAAVFQTSASSEDDSGVVVLFFLGLIVVVVLKLATSGESKAQKQKKFQKALNEANTPLAQNETGNAAHASMKDLKKRGWA